MQVERNKTNSKCVKLESPRTLYDALLLRINENFGEKEKDLFEFSFRHELPNPVLQTRKPLIWFQKLEQRDKLSWNDVYSLADFLARTSYRSLLSDVHEYQARIKVIIFFQKNLQARMPEICLDEKFNEKWRSEQNLSKHYIKKCQELLRRTQSRDSLTSNPNLLRCLFCRGVNLLIMSCSQPANDDLQLVSAIKLLYLTDLFYKTFKETIVSNKDLLNIQPLPSGKFRDLGGNRGGRRRRLSANYRRRSSVPAQGDHHELTRRRSSFETISYLARLHFLFFFGLFASFLVSIF